MNSLENASTTAWSRAFIALSRTLILDNESRRIVKRTLLAHSADLTAPLVLLVQRADVDDFLHTCRRVFATKKPTLPFDESAWRAFATAMVGSATLTVTNSNANNFDTDSVSVAETEMQREREMRALAAFDVHELNKLHLRDDSERRFDVRSHINPVFISEESIVVPRPVAPIVATPVPELRLEALQPAHSAASASSARPIGNVAKTAEPVLHQFAQPTAFSLPTFSHNDVERLNAERRALLAAATVDSEHAGTVVSTVAIHNEGTASFTRSELANAVDFLEGVQAALADAPLELERFFHLLEEYQRNRSATVDDTLRQLHALLVANKQAGLAAELLQFLPKPQVATTSGLLAQRLADATASEFQIAAADVEQSLQVPTRPQTPQSQLLLQQQQQQLQQLQQQQLQQQQHQAFQMQYQLLQPVQQTQFQQQQQQSMFQQQALLPTAPTTFNIYQQAVVQQQQDMMFVAPTVTSGLLGGAPDSADAAVERIARLKALKALRESRTLRESAALLVRAAARFVHGGVDKKFLAIMREHAAGTLDRAQVVTRVHELFAESNDVERGEGKQIVDAFTQIRARAQQEQAVG